jgi:toxin ParE1/3/4
VTRYELRPQAEADLAEIWRFTAKRWNAEQADKYSRNIVDALAKVAEQPSLGRACDNVRKGYLRYNVASHVLFYRLEADHLDVVRILHARREFRRLLPKR